jgi:hypothetical protein
MPESWYYAIAMQELLADLASRYVQRVERFDETVASYERLGFEQVRAWSGDGEARSALFRTGPALLEVVESDEPHLASPE